MGSAKKNKKRPQIPQSQSESPLVFQSLLSAIEAPEGLKPPFLKRLYYLLTLISSSLECTNYGEIDLDSSLYVAIGQHGISFTFESVGRLSHILFKELSARFEQLVSAHQGAISGKPLVDNTLQSGISAFIEELNLLLRCCMVLLSILIPHQHVLENGQALLAMLRKLNVLALNGANGRNSSRYEKSISRGCTYSKNDCTTSFAEDFIASLYFLEPSDPYLPFFSAMLEVFVDELSGNRQLRTYFKVIDSLACTNEKLFMHHSGHGDLGILMEVLCTHFSLSFSDEQAFESFINKLFLLQAKTLRTELSLCAANSLLHNNVILSAPKYMQAHLILLAALSIGICVEHEKFKLDFRLIDYYLPAFERSVILYNNLMPTLQMNGHLSGASASFVRSNPLGENFQPSFECYVKSVSRESIKRLISSLDDMWHSHLGDTLFKTKPELMISARTFINENEHILDMSCRDDIIQILNCILERAAADVNNTALHSSLRSPEDLFLHASILKLMSSSLLQIIFSLRHSGNLGHAKTLKNFSSCKEYDSLVSVIRRFERPNICLPIQKDLCEIIESQPTRHKESKLMFLHFSGLLSLSFIGGFDFFVKGCMLCIMALMNLFVFEEGNLEALRSMTEVLVVKNPSQSIASKFQRTKTLYMRASHASDCTRMEDRQVKTFTSESASENRDCVSGIEEETEQTCNGEIFFKCLVDQQEKLSEFEDLADFVECRKGKDYSDWLKDRQKYRKRKSEKMAVLRWKKRQKTWKLIKGM